MTKKNKKIIIILAGGTCLLDKDSRLLVVNKPSDISDWLKQMPELSILADIETNFVMAENDILGPAIWQKMAKVISTNQNKADGFVVVAKIDQLINTALALNFLLQNLKKNIILTSSQVSGATFLDKKELINKLQTKHGGLGLRANLINALQIADQPLPGPAIFFGTRLIPALKAIDDMSSDLNRFASWDQNYWGKVDFGINLKSGLKYPDQQTDLFTNLDSRVLVIENIVNTVWPFNKDYLNNYQAIIIKVDPYQELEETKQKQISSWKKPVVLYNYLGTPVVKGAVSVSNCTFNTALIKTMWASANYKKIGDFEDIMKQNIIGEFN